MSFVALLLFVEKSNITLTLTGVQAELGNTSQNDIFNTFIFVLLVKVIHYFYKIKRKGKIMIQSKLQELTFRYQMLHTRFQGHQSLLLDKRIFKVYTVYVHGGCLGHVGHVTWFQHILFPPALGLYMQFGYN